MMKKIVLGTMLLLSVCAHAQQRVRSVSVELLGAQNTVGVNYDSRFKGNSGWGYRVGIGFGYGDNSSFLEQNIKGVGVPLELNYLLGRNRHKLELGMGTSLGVYHVKETNGYVYPTPDDEVQGVKFYTSQHNQFGYHVFGDIGYRYQRENGFLFRVGFSPSFNFGDKYGLSKSFFYPYIGFGWSF